MIKLAEFTARETPQNEIDAFIRQYKHFHDCILIGVNIRIPIGEGDYVGFAMEQNYIAELTMKAPPMIFGREDGEYEDLIVEILDVSNLEIVDFTEYDNMIQEIAMSQARWGLKLEIPGVSFYICGKRILFATKTPDLKV